MASLPVDVRIGKLLILGTLLQCADPALTLAAALSQARSPFVAPYGRRAEADESKANWAVGLSDHMAVLRAYQAFDQLRGMRARAAFCSEHFLSMKSLETIAQTKRELLEHLWEIGFVRAGASARQADLRASAVARGGGDEGDGVRAALGGAGSANAADAELLKALLVGAMWPKVAKLEAPAATGKGGGKGGRGGKGSGKGGGGKGGRGGKGGDASGDSDAKLKVKDDTGVATATLHPSCVAAQASSRALKAGSFLVYGELVKTSCLFIRDLTVVPPVALMLFGGRLSVDSKASLVLLDDGWVRFKVPPEVAGLIVALRAGLEDTLRRKIEQPTLDLSSASAALIDGVVQLIASEGAAAGGSASATPRSQSAIETIAFSAVS